MFHVELAPLGGILGPLKSDLGVFWAKIPLYPYNVKFSKSIFSKSANLPILSFWILNLHIIICQFQKRSTVKDFFSLTACSCHLCGVSCRTSQSQGTSERCNERKGTMGRVVFSFEPFLIGISIITIQDICSLYITFFVTTFITSTGRTNKAVQGEGGHSFEHLKGKEQK